MVVEWWGVDWLSRANWKGLFRTKDTVITDCVSHYIQVFLDMSHRDKLVLIQLTLNGGKESKFLVVENYSNCDVQNVEMTSTWKII